jgi:hypothetical protein
MFIRPKWFDKDTRSWLALNTAALLVSLLLPLILSSFLTIDAIHSVILAEAASMLGYNLVFNGWLDYTYRKMPRWNLVYMGIIQTVFTVISQLIAGSAYTLWYAVPIAVVIWLFHFFMPKNVAGMSDGRLLYVYILALMPIMMSKFIIPLAIMAIVSIVSLVYRMIRSSISLFNREGAKEKLGPIHSKFPMGPIAGISFTIGLILFLFL